MITLLCYWWILMWNIDVNKELFATFSTIELGGELLLGLPLIIGSIYITIEERMRKNDKGTN